MKKVTNTIKSASSIIAILAISAFSFNTFASETEYNKSYSCVETATETSCNLSIIKPTAEDKLLVKEWKGKVEFSTCSVETDEKIECNLTAYYEEEPVQEASEEFDEIIESLENIPQSDVWKSAIHDIESGKVKYFVQMEIGNGLYILNDKLGLVEVKDISQDYNWLAIRYELIKFTLITMLTLITLIVIRCVFSEEDSTRENAKEKGAV
ncbi:hypothetical protein K3Z84_00530 [Pseudomonas aeruginosa]|nr:hypothetical protein [Pseudomonas aeruginosa]